MIQFARLVISRIGIKIINGLLNFESWCIAIKIKSEIKIIGKDINIELPISTLGLSCVKIGDNFNVRKNFKLRAYQEYASTKTLS